MKELKIKKLHPEAVVPTRAHATDAGLDLVSVETGELPPGAGRIFKTGLAVELDEGYVALVWDRSSMGKKGIKTLGGVIDSGYRGDIGVILWNLSSETVSIRAGDRIAQLLIQKVELPQTKEVSELGVTSRGAGGFGSSGV